jgi:alanyl-tRNA synthetase
MQSNEVRKRYLEFFEKRGHAIIPSASLVPENDPTTLFTGSGMQPLLPYLLGEKHPKGSRLADSQKCFRSEDIEEIGDNRHTTFFEMLGNWSLGDPASPDGIGKSGYFKKEQLRWFFEFLTDSKEGIGLDPARLYVTVFSGDKKMGIPKDEESVEIWKEIFREKKIEAKEVFFGAEDAAYARGIKKNERIFYYDAKKNWWSRAGSPENMPPGEPGGPDSEVFYDFGSPHDKSFGENCHPNCDCGRFMEIGNSVFMEYIKKKDGTFASLPQKNVDFGGGLERITAASNNDSDVFNIDTLRVIIEEIEKLSAKQYGDKKYATSFRIISDHIRGAVFMITDGVVPSNTDRGYFVRRLLRRAIRHMDLLGIRENTLSKLVEVVANSYSQSYPDVADKIGCVKEEVQKEEERFRKTLDRGLKELEKLFPIGSVEEIKNGTMPKALNRVNAEKAFFVYQTYGFPLELIQEELAKRGLVVDEEEFREQVKKHQEISRVGVEQKFKGGLADHSDMSIRYHTATHLLHQALREILGRHVVQKGSNITPERLRFDFTHPQKVTEEEIRQVEDLVNQKIDEALPVSFEILPIEKARERGAIGVFDSKYGEEVKVYTIGDISSGVFSVEFCGGPHVKNTGELSAGGRRFKIKKEEAVSAGVRRIKAVLE